GRGNVRDRTVLRLEARAARLLPFPDRRPRPARDRGAHDQPGLRRDARLSPAWTDPGAPLPARRAAGARRGASARGGRPRPPRDLRAALVSPRRLAAAALPVGRRYRPRTYQLTVASYGVGASDTARSRANPSQPARSRYDSRSRVSRTIRSRRSTRLFASKSPRRSTSERTRVVVGSRARSKRFSSNAASGSRGASWSASRIVPPGLVRRASSAIISSGRGVW